MKNKFVILIISFSVLAPQIAFASWYDFMNPLSWFTREKVNYQSKDTEESLDINGQKISPIITSTEPEVVEKTVIREVKVPMEKTITRTVNSPELLKQIAILKAEKDQLKSSLDYAINKIAELNSKIDELNKTISSNAKIQSITPGITEQNNANKARIEGISQGEKAQKDKEILFFNSLVKLDLAKTEHICRNRSNLPRILTIFEQVCSDYMANEIIRNSEDIKRICVGVVPGIRGGEDTRANVAQERIDNPDLDKACRISGY